MFAPDDSPEKLAEILNKFPGPVMLYPSKLMWIPNLLVVMPFMVGLGVWGLWMFVTEGRLFDALLGGFLFFEWMRRTTGFIIGAMWLRLDAHGFEARFAGPRVRRDWKDVAEFVPWMIRWWPFVVYTDRTPAKAWELSRILYFGGKAWFRDTYGLSPKDLAELMNAWRDRALAQRQ